MVRVTMRPDACHDGNCVKEFPSGKFINTFDGGVNLGVFSSNEPPWPAKNVIAIFPMSAIAGAVVVEDSQ